VPMTEQSAVSVSCGSEEALQDTEQRTCGVREEPRRERGSTRMFIMMGMIPCRRNSCLYARRYLSCSAMLVESLAGFIVSMTSTLRIEKTSSLLIAEEGESVSFCQLVE